MAYRVIQWSTGNVGALAARGIINHPDLELAGLWVHSPDKVGKDAGVLAGVGPVGVTATNDADALLALDADCVCYTATGDLRPHEAVADITAILRSGKNVVASSLVPMIYPDAAPAEMRDPIAAACIEGEVSFFTSGIDPGFANTVLPLVLSGACERIDQIRIQEILNYATYDEPTTLFTTMGFGQKMDETPILLAPGVLTLAWGGVLHLLASTMGTDLTDIEEWYDKRPAPRDLQIASGTIEEGTMAGLRFEVRGRVRGETRIVIEHVTRMADDMCSDWPASPGKGGYVVQITGSPNITCTLQMEDGGGDENAAGLLVTAMRLLNAIPAVCAAPPGLLSDADLPVVAGRGLMA
jgi:4-hydroxy-tetrahydrodipicolinate reductase